MEDDDITLLRLTALKSLNAKKEADLLIQTSRAVEATKRISRSRSASPHSGYNNHSSSSRKNYSPPRRHRADNHHTLSAIFNNGSPPHFAYVPSKIHHPSAAMASSVQLSPRSAAFVLQNNDILARRIEGSPTTPPPKQSHAYRAHHHQSPPPGRWSESPPPASVYSPKARREFTSRRSRSPLSNYAAQRVASPWSTSLHQSRETYSPPSSRESTYRVAPTIPLSPEGAAQRPPTITDATNQSKHRNISPHARRRSPSRYRRTPDPPSNHQAHSSPSNLQRPRNTIHKVHSKHPAATNTSNNSHHNRRRSRSPQQQSRAKVSRSQSHSPPPQRKQDSMQRNKARTTPNGHRERSRNGRHSQLRPARHGERSATQSVRKRSRSPLAKAIPTLTTVNIVEESEPMVNEAKAQETIINAPTSIVPSPDVDDANVVMATIDGSDDSAASSVDDDANDNGDEIDLFASEESESENEGRFKSATKPERNPQVAAVSFSALVSGSLASSVNSGAIERNLDDISATLGHAGDADRRTTRNRRDRGGRDRRWEGGERNRVRGGERVSSNSHQSSSTARGNGGDHQRQRELPQSERRVDNRASSRDRADSRRQSPSAIRKHGDNAIEASRSANGSKYDGSTSSQRSSHQSTARHTSRSRAVGNGNRNAESAGSGSTIKSTVASTVSTVSKADIGSSVVVKAAECREPSLSAVPVDLPDDSSTSVSTTKKAVRLRLGAMTQTWKSHKSHHHRSSASPEKV